VTRGSTEANLSKEVRSGAAGHVTTPVPTSVERCLDLELICGGTRSS
jgi:hypothetical protein